MKIITVHFNSIDDVKKFNKETKELLNNGYIVTGIKKKDSYTISKKKNNLNNI